MKTNNILITAVVVLLIMATSCKKTFFTDVNKNPNAPVAAPPATVLASLEGSLAYTQGGDMSRYASMFTQQTLGASRQAQGYYKYIITGQDIDNLWGNLYTGTMNNINNLMQLADKGDGVGPYNGYSGVSRLLMAYTLLITSDFWGSIPYSQAFQGASNLHPAYDKDQDIYASILSLVNKGIADLQNAKAGTLTPGSEDIIYGGDPNKWIKFGWALKARIYIHQSKGNSTMAANAKAAVDSSFASSADNAVYAFGTTETSSNPWYQFNEQREDIDFTHSTLADSLLATGDPRTNFEIDTTFSDAFGSGEAAYYGSINSVVELITYDELQLIAAEADVRSDNGGAAQTEFTGAITANMQKAGVSGGVTATYLVAKGTLSSNQTTALNQIGYQAWIALYQNPEAWTTWRRIGYPALNATGGTNGVPRRFLYPQTELFYNGANVPSNATMWSPKIFWDN